MFSVAEYLDSVKARAGIDSDYRLAAVIEISRGAIGNYRNGVSLPDERVIAKLCELVGDDADLIAVQIQAARAKTDQARSMWMHIAERLRHAPTALAGHVAVVMAFCLFASNFVASDADAASDSALLSFNPLYTVCILC